MTGNEDNSLAALIWSVKHCRICEQALPLGPRPVIQFDPRARILIAGQAPGRRVHETGVPFDDPSGERLRDWLGVSRDLFYDITKIAILPMGFCYPGTGKSGDLPPRPECAPAWRTQLMDTLKKVRLTVVIGQYAQKWHLPSVERNLTETVRAWQNYGGGVIPLPHPSPRNNIWIKKNPWFAESLLPALQQSVRDALR
ncbi:MAG: uracil-DNA glycosylase family protein [Chromatiaceae bacterium]|jgi:uracil-DNA glycosylase